MSHVSIPIGETMGTFPALKHLKLYVMAHGVDVDAGAENAWRDLYEGGPLSLKEYASTSGIALYIKQPEGDIYMNAPFGEGFTMGTEAHLRFMDGTFVITKGRLEVPVTVIPVPGYHNQEFVDSGGVSRRYTSIGVTHTDRIRVSPIAGCAWFCQFCNTPYELEYTKKRMEDLLRVIQIAENDSLAPARHVLISGGTPRPEDEEWLDEVFAYLAAYSPTPVDVMMPPRERMSYPAWLKSVGVNMVSINMEIWDPKHARVITPNKYQRVGQQGYLDYIEECVKAFRVGFVQSLMVFGGGVEPVDSTLKGVRALVERGCIPVLSPFRPDPRTPMRHRPPASPDEMMRVYETTLDICERSGMRIKPGPRCVPCHHNTIAFPDGSDFYVGLGGDLRRPLWTS